MTLGPQLLPRPVFSATITSSPYVRILVLLLGLKRLGNTDGATLTLTWRCGTIISLYKAGAPEEPGNYRGITLLSVFRKLFGTLLKLRLQNNVNLYESQAVFRNGRGCIDHIYTFARIVRAAARKHVPLYAFFLDIRKAYDTV